MSDIKSYRDLVAWQKAMDLVEGVYQATRSFPSEERFGLTAQVRRAAVSVPSNIAEGHGRRTRQDYMRFLDISRGSLNEIDTQLRIADRLGFLPKEHTEGLLTTVDEVHRILYGLMQAIENADKSRYDS